MRRLLPAILLTVALFPGGARAITQPDGTPIPFQQGTYDLWQTFTGIGESQLGQDPPSYAADLPETFTPSCSLQFELVSRGGASMRDAFGWYNVNPDGGAPDPADLHGLLDCNASNGTVVPFDLTPANGYAGGEVGFF